MVKSNAYKHNLSVQGLRVSEPSAKSTNSQSSTTSSRGTGSTLLPAKTEAEATDFPRYILDECKAMKVDSLNQSFVATLTGDPTMRQAFRAKCNSPSGVYPEGAYDRYLKSVDKSTDAQQTTEGDEYTSGASRK